MWPGAEVNVDAGRQRDAVKAWQSLNSQVGPKFRMRPNYARKLTEPPLRLSLMRPPFDRPVYI